MNKHLSKLVLALGLFSTALIGLGHAEDASAAKIKLKATPVELHHELKPESTVAGSFNFYNEGDAAVEYTVTATPYYDSEDEKGEHKVTYENAEDLQYSEIVDWITFSDGEGTLEPGEKVTINYSINVPKDAPGGGQYAALLVSAHGLREEKEGATINETANIGPIVYATVDGETRKTAEITDLSTGGFLFNPPISVSSRVKNTGNIHGTAEYILRVFPFFGGESLYNNEDNPETMVILPGATRYYNLSWTSDQGAPSIGIYKVEAEVKIFDQTEKLEKTVIICPMWVLILIVVFILAVIFWLVARAKSRKQ